MSLQCNICVVRSKAGLCVFHLHFCRVAIRFCVAGLLSFLCFVLQCSGLWVFLLRVVFFCGCFVYIFSASMCREWACDSGLY